ncbi:MAG: LptA/OstA family protein [Nitrospirota bacterium]
MLKQPFISSLFIFVILSTNVFSAEKAQQIKGPIIITSEILTVDNEANTALFENSVVARTTDMTIYANKMFVHYNKDTGNVTKIEATGSVKLIIKGTRTIISNEAIYFANESKVIFTGEPRATEGENVVTGRKMTYLLNEDRFLVENSKVFLTKKKGQ